MVQRGVLLAILACWPGLAHAKETATPDKTVIAARAVAERAKKAIGDDHYFKQPDGATLAWGESYFLMAVVSLAESTGEARHHDLVRDHAKRILALRSDHHGQKDELRGTTIKAWTTARYTKGKHHAHAVHTGMITYPIARWCYVVRRDPALRRTYGKDVAAFVPQLIESLAAFDADFRQVKGTERGYYAPFDSSRYTSTPYNFASAMGRAYVMLWLITGKAELRRRAARIAGEFRAALRKVKDRYDWPYASYRPKGSEDISHAAINVDFAFQCYRAGIVFQQGDMLRFVATLAHLRAGTSGYHDLVNGTGGPSAKYSREAGRWLRLGYLDASVRRAYAQHLFANQKTLPPLSRLLGAAYLAETGAPLRMEKPLRNP